MAQLLEWLLRVAYIVFLLDDVLSIEDPVITTKLGKLRGKVMSTSGKAGEFLAFRGIPYARPPLNNQRFKLPIPIDPWDGILNVTADGQRCWQMTSLLADGSYCDEDCLNLNVYVPQARLTRVYPVMIFIHGGAFDSGSGSSWDYGPQEFMNTDAVILVTMNYRVGIFGFLCTEDEISPGNYGLWDQNLALKWVQENIESFGGDKNRVTIMGESAGAGSVTLHLLSPDSKGLFSGAICESGTAVSDRTLQLHPLDHARQLARNLDCPIHSNVEMIKCLREKPVQDIVLNGSYKNKTSFPFRFWPVIDKDFGGPVFIHDSPRELLRNFKINIVPVISGANKDEGIFYYLKEFFASKLSIENNGLFSIDNLRHLAPTLAPHLMADKENGPTLFNEIVDAYFKEVDQTNEEQVILKISQFVTDSKMNVYVDFTNKMLVEHGAPVYVYKLTHRGKVSLLDLMPIRESTNQLLADLNIVVHADELQFLYQCGFFKKLHLDKKDRRMSDIILTLWTNFAKTGVPSLNGLSSEIASLEWPSITKEKYSYLNLSLNPHIVNGQLNTMPDLWNVLKAFAAGHRIFPSIQQSVQVEIKQGIINGFTDQGENRNGFYSFLGIPYAQPPIDDLRFKDPVPHKGWSGVLEAKEYGPSCPQWDQVTSTVIGNEDCLTLNVFTHRFGYMGGHGLTNPVLVFIHGGAFMRGSSASYGPAKLLASPVVLVTVNYRLGALGFLSTEDYAAPGNYGMLDLVLALSWIRDNINTFGGNPEKITIAGNSAGAAAVSHLIVSPLARGLFSGAIAQSGSALCDWAVEKEPFNYAAMLASDLGCSLDSSSDIVDCLRQKSAAEIIQAQQSHCMYAGFFPLRTAPVVDRGFRNQPFLPDLPENLLKNGDFSMVPLISGVVQDEGLLFLLKMLQEYGEDIARDPRFLEDTLLPKAVDAMTDGWYTPNKIEMVKKFYFKDVDFQNIGEVIPPFVELLSDILFFSCNDKMLKLHSKFATAYMYVFSYRGNNSYSDALIKEAINMKIQSPMLSHGASHVDDVLYLFNLPNIGPSKLVEDKKMQDLMVFLWTTFADRSTPNIDSQNSYVFWQSLRETSLTFLNISAYTYVGSGFRQFQLSIYDYINKIPPSPSKYTETRESYYIATWVLVTLCIIFIVACTSLIVLLIKAARKRTYSTKNIDNLPSMGMLHPKVE